MSQQTMNVRSFLVVLALIIALSALILSSGCSSADSGGMAWRHETTTENGRTTVRTLGGSVWEGKARLEEQASIGSTDGPDEYLLARPYGLASDGERIFVLDTQVPVVRAYDWQGNHLTDIGREGEGPGEYRQPRSLTMDPASGTLFVGQRDRITMFTREGEPAGTRRFPSTFSTSRPMTLTEDGDLYMPELLNPGSDLTEWQLGMIHFSPAGDAKNDTIRAPEFDFEEWRIIGRSENGTSSNDVPFAPDSHWSMAVNRAMVAGVSTDYSFRVLFPDGRSTLIEKADWDPVPVKRDEAAWFREAATLNMRSQFEGWSWNGPGIPDHKPAYGSLVPDRSERIWVGREGEGQKVEGCDEDPEEWMDYYREPCWTAETHWDLFRMSGEYLGEVEVPDGLSISSRSWIQGEDVVSIYTDPESGVPYVKRYRLVTP